MRKPDDAEIGAHLAALPTELHLDSRRSWWPKYFYRFDDVESVANILQSGTLLSRDQCQLRGVQHRDAANQEIIRSTKQTHKYVRLYFRPLTPTQYRMEGIKARDQIASTLEHCPVPVFLLFDAKAIAGAQGVRFTNGGAANSRAAYGDDIEFLRSIPFESVYHDGRIEGDESEKREVVFRRHAEILIEDELPLASLKLVMCRTGPERDTLLHLLEGAREKYEPIVKLAGSGIALFYRSGTYVESIRLVQETLYLRFPPRIYLYNVNLTIEPVGGTKGPVGRLELNARVLQELRINLKHRYESALVTIIIDGCLAYKAVITQEAIVGG